MKNFWALPAVFRAALVLAAQHHSFSVNDDLLAYPQYEVRWSEDFVTEALAHTKLQHHRQQSIDTERADTSGDDTESHIDRYRPPAESRDKSEDGHELYYEEMTLDRQKYLCAIPDVTMTQEDQGSGNDTLSKIEEERELARANERGWELMSGMQGNCIYYNSGWWSYSFCYNTGVRQFHQLPPTRGMPTWPPLEDPTVPGFSLGKHSAKTHDQETRDDVAKAHSGAATNGELVVKGETRYLVQRLEGGTQCDLTGDERRVEIQFHCNPTVGMDYISLIKELSTCTYLMVVQTPRLCDDVAFLPPQKDRPHSIICQPILQPEDVDQYEKDLAFVKETIRRSEELIEQANDETSEDTSEPRPPFQIVGDIIIGSHEIVPRDLKLEKSAIVGGGKETFIATVAKSDGQQMSKTEMEKIGLVDSKAVEKLREKLDKLAGAKGWKLDVIDTPRGREYRGIIDEEGEEEDAHNTDDTAGDNADSDESGSQEEFYKEEL